MQTERGHSCPHEPAGRTTFMIGNRLFERRSDVRGDKGTPLADAAAGTPRVSPLHFRRKIIVALCTTYDTLVHELDRSQFMTEYNFDLFEEGPIEPSGNRVGVSINSRGHFYVNRKAIIAMGEPDAVVLYFDRERKAIGMQRSPIGRKNAFRLVNRASESGRLIFATNFCRHYKIMPQATIRFAAPQANKDGILILDLYDTVPARNK